MSEIASDLVSYDRSLPDDRPQACRKLYYDVDSFQDASVIIVFTNEPYSSLVRTVHSIVNRSPPKLLREIILVDDLSTNEDLKERLEVHMARFNGLVRLIRAKERLGLIKARMVGARAAVAGVIVFIDAHCEANEGWLEPLLDRISEDPMAVVCPVIGSISAEDMRYLGGSAGGIGSFWWSLHYKNEPISAKEKARRKNPAIDYIRSPTMAGGLFAANRYNFFRLGGYDEGMEIWGGENLEISFRVWMCGGSIEIIPCSIVGHIFRAGHPYNMTGRNGNLDVHGTNSRRLAEVWMDDYKRLYYRHRYELQFKDVGDLSDRIELRKKLNCKPFKWYLQNIADYMFIPDENVLAFGQVKNRGNDLCIDTLQRNEFKHTVVVGMFYCQDHSEPQMFSYSNEKELRRETTCIDQKNYNAKRSEALLHDCSTEKLSVLNYVNGTFIHSKTGLCLDATGVKSGDDLYFSTCEPGNESQQWGFKKVA